jgi:hypothetical protein
VERANPPFLYSLVKSYSNARKGIGGLSPKHLIHAGPILYLGIQIILRIQGLKFDYWRSGPWQLIPRDILSNQPLQSLWYLHVQPPGFNTTAMIFDQFGSRAELIWQSTIILGTYVSIWMVSRIVWIWTDQFFAGVFTGAIYAFLPSTHLYSMWLFYTQPVAILLVFMVYGVVRGRETANSSFYILSILSVTSLFLWRSSVVWLMAIGWIIFVISIALKENVVVRYRRFLRLFVFSIFAILIVVLFSSKNYLVFASPTQSSWSAENYAKVLFYSASEKELNQIASKNDCFKELVSVGVFQDINDYPTCTNGFTPSAEFKKEILVLSQDIWSDGIPNFNNEKRLLLQEKWREFNIEFIKSNPKVLSRVLWPSFSDERRGSIVQFLWIATDYKFLDENRQSLGATGKIWELSTFLIGPISLIFWFYLFYSRYILKISVKRDFVLQTGASIFIFVLLMEYIFLEIGENQRYRVEIEPLILVMGITGFTQFLRNLKTTKK